MARQKSEFLKAFGTIFEIWKRIIEAVQKLGGSDEDLRKILTEKGMATKIAEIIMAGKAAAAAVKKFVSEISAAELIPSGWKVEEDVEPSTFRIEDIEFPTFLVGGESSIYGTVLRQRAVEQKANLGLVDLKRVLAEQGKLPTELRGKYLVFAGTLLRGSGGGLCVPFLYWDGDRWVLGFGWVGGGFDGDGRLARSK